MRRFDAKHAVLLFVVSAATVGCRGFGGGEDLGELMRKQMAEANASQQKQFAQSRLEQDLSSNPDLPAWHEQRERMTLALGDRQFDKGFDSVFDGMTVALATLGCRVQNMERASGYITTSIPELPPNQLEALSRESVRAYAVAKGYPASIVDDDEDGNFRMSSMFYRFASGLTLSMVKQGPQATKVKLRFDNVYYPGMVEEYYKIVWAAVDKQMFLDRGLD